jgi:pimeloyl-ACP methyl ester carboxylesterase
VFLRALWLSWESNTLVNRGVQRERVRAGPRRGLGWWSVSLAVAMLDQPETRYAKSGGLKIGYQVAGEGPLDLVFVPGLLSHIDLVWSFPAAVRFFRRLTSFSRLIIYDKRGQGVSDPPAGIPTLEQDMEDLLAVLAAAGAERAALFGYSEGGPMSSLFAATHPDRVTALILFGAVARGADLIERAEELGWDAHDRTMGMLEHWGEGRGLEVFAPSIVTEDRIRRFGAFERAVASPTVLRARWETAVGLDVTPVLETLQVPTLVLHRADERAVPAILAREMADAIPGAHYVEVPGIDHIPWVADAEQILDEVEEFLTGARHATEADRVLATVMFTDIVDSTRRAAELGDSRWRALVESHDQLVRDELDRYRGREIKTMGDGFLVTFDGPARGIRCARAITQQLPALGVDVRAGLHTGECMVMGDDVGGMAVNIGARVGGLADRGEVLVSSTVKDLVVGSGIDFEDRGLHELKGVPGHWHLFAVASV